MLDLKIFAGNSNHALSSAIAKEIGASLGQCQVKRFADGEIQVEIQQNVRGSDVFVIQSTCPPSNENYMELFLMLDAFKRASASRITAVIPYFGYARQDRKVAPRAPISAKCIADLITTAGAQRVLAVDLHAGQIQGFFNVPVDHLFAIPTLARSLREKWGVGEDIIVVSPDAGGVERARAFAKRMECSIAIIDKRRLGPNEAVALHVIGDVKGKTAIILDDIIDTAGTLIQAVDSVIKNGAKRVFAVATHAVLSGPAISRIQASQLEEVVFTNTIPLSPEAQACEKIKVITVAPLVAEAIKRIHGNDSVSSLFV
ncbi:MAG: ribose-phosphate pyrophosphokinase [Bdellovibrionales bacterium]